MKGNGKLKDQMKSWNIYQLVTNYVNLTCNKEMDKITIIRKLVQNNRSWIKFLQNKWIVHDEKSSEYMCFKLITNSGTCSNNISKISVIHQSKVMNYKSGVVECSCRDFKSKKIPCQHICLVNTSQNCMSLFTVETFHPYWCLPKCPLYNGVVGNIVFDSLYIMTNLTDSKTSLSDYQKLIFPTNQRVRFLNL